MPRQLFTVQLALDYLILLYNNAAEAEIYSCNLNFNSIKQ